MFSRNLLIEELPQVDSLADLREFVAEVLLEVPVFWVFPELFDQFIFPVPLDVVASQFELVHFESSFVFVDRFVMANAFHGFQNLLVAQWGIFPNEKHKKRKESPS